MFRMEFDVFPELDDNNVYLEIDMLFYEFDPQNQILQKSEENVISTVSFKISNVATGLKEYVCGNFQGNHYSVLNMTIHSLLTEYRYRHINKSISELTEAEIYKMIFDPKTAAEYESKDSLQTYIQANLPKDEVGVHVTRNWTHSVRDWRTISRSSTQTCCVSTTSSPKSVCSTSTRRSSQSTCSRNPTSWRCQTR